MRHVVTSCCTHLEHDRQACAAQCDFPHSTRDLEWCRQITRSDGQSPHYPQLSLQHEDMTKSRTFADYFEFNQDEDCVETLGDSSSTILFGSFQANAIYLNWSANDF